MVAVGKLNPMSCEYEIIVVATRKLDSMSHEYELDQLSIPPIQYTHTGTIFFK
jgi:hypothetical protein